MFELMKMGIFGVLSVILIGVTTLVFGTFILFLALAPLAFIL